MPAPFLTDAAKDALTGAVRAVEQQSAAEVVIAVRARSGSYLHAAVVVGAAVAFAAQAYLLYAEATFALIWVLLDPFIAGLFAGIVTSKLGFAQRLLTPRTIRSRYVRRAAEATFYEKGVRLTRDRTGILVYISMLERAACVVADRGVVTAVALDDWARIAGRIDAAVAAGEDGEAVAARIAEMGELLAPVLPRAADDANELSDDVYG